MCGMCLCRFNKTGVYGSTRPIWLVGTVWRMRVYVFVLAYWVSMKSKHDLRLKWVRPMSFINIVSQFQIHLKVRLYSIFPIIIKSI